MTQFIFIMLGYAALIYLISFLTRYRALTTRNRTLHKVYMYAHVVLAGLITIAAHMNMLYLMYDGVESSPTWFFGVGFAAVLLVGGALLRLAMANAETFVNRKKRLEREKINNDTEFDSAADTQIREIR